MKKIKKNSLWSLLFCIVLIINNGFSQHNWEYRSQYEIAYSTPTEFILKIKPQLRFNGIINELKSTHIEIGVDKKVNEWFRLGPYYRHIIQIEGDNRLIEYRPQLEMTFSSKLGYYSFCSRNRFEYRIKSDNKSVRYRNRLTAKSPVYFNNKVWLSISEELFFDCKKKEFNKNWVFFNLGFPLKNNISLELFYILEYLKKEDKWQSSNVCGNTLKYKI